MRRALVLLAALVVSACSSEPPPPRPSGMLLVSVDGPNGRGDIYAVPLDGRRPRNLTRTPEDEFHPSWSPDGRSFVFMRYAALFIRDADGSRERRLTTSAPEQGPEWSPDGRSIAFVADRPGRVEEAVWTIRPDGTHRRLVGGRGDFPESPTWSPDGKRIAFSSDVPHGSSDDTRIWVMNVDGTNAHPVSKGTIDIDPAWSPRGDRIAFTRGFELLTTSPDEVDERSLSQSVMTPGWSPDGRWISAVQLDRRTRRFGLYAIPIDGGTSRPILRLRGLVYSPASWCATCGSRR